MRTAALRNPVFRVYGEAVPVIRALAGIEETQYGKRVQRRNAEEIFEPGRDHPEADHRSEQDLQILREQRAAGGRRQLGEIQPDARPPHAVEQNLPLDVAFPHALRDRAPPARAADHLEDLRSRLTE